MGSLTAYRTLEVFQDLSDDQFAQISSILAYRQIPAGQIIFEQGIEASYLYILLSGKVAIRYKPYDGPPLIVATILQGMVFGWSAALGRRQYTSSAHALEDCTALCITRENFLDICKIDSDTGIIFLERISKNIADRLHQTDNKILSILTSATEYHAEG